MTAIEDPAVGLGTPYREYIHMTRYSRWRDDLGRRETWTESVERYVDFVRWLAERAPTPYALADEEVSFVRDSILGCEAMCSMRALMTAGPAAMRDNAAIYNCVGFQTTILTADGPKRIGDVTGTEQIVLDGDGRWTPAAIRSFGKQRLVRITLRPGVRGQTRIRRVVEATPDHRWITSNRGEVKDLRAGDVIPFVGARTGVRDNEAWVRGFGFGDGTHLQTGQAVVRLCGKKAQHLELVASVGGGSTSYPPSYGGDPNHVFHKGVMSDWKTLPAESESAAYLTSWLDGYLAADSSIDGNTTVLSSQNEAALDFVERIAPIAGYAVTGRTVSSQTETNYGSRSAPLGYLRLRRDTRFTVVSVEDLGIEEEVYCATVPTTGSFVLADGVLTGNCTAVAIDDPRAFDETVYLLMCGTGVGFSVERQFINKLPEVPDRFFESRDVIVVEDSRRHWAAALRRLMAALWAGHVPQWDLSLLRTQGTPLKTFGGRASGPAPLEELFRHVVAIFRHAAGRRLTSVECHSIMCKVGDIVTAGGSRRSAEISLSNPSDDRMRDAKSGDWHRTEPHFALANNSAIWTEQPDPGRFMREWLALYESKSGERGIINRTALKEQARKTGRRDPDHDFLVNPCAEIVLRPCQMCNLTEAVARAGDELEQLQAKVRAATIMGTLQTICTDFAYLRPIWRQNCEEERLLGVSLTGQMDHEVLSKTTVEAARWWGTLKETVLETNREWAARLGIEPSAATTTQKPSGTVSQLVDAASGGHARYARYYVRRTRDSKMDPVAEAIRRAGVPHEEDVRDRYTWVFEWPVAAPEGAVVTDDMTAIEQLERWLHVKQHWCEHSASATIQVGEDEWLAVGAWVYKHFDEICGLAFLPRDGGTYTQAPYEAITAEQYAERVAAMPDSIDWEALWALEQEDRTTSSREVSCSGDSCEL